VVDLDGFLAGWRSFVAESELWPDFGLNLMLRFSSDLVISHTGVLRWRDELDVSFFSALADFMGLFLKVRMVCDGWWYYIDVMVAAVEPICAPKVQEECVGERAEYHARFVCILLSSGCGVSYYHFTWANNHQDCVWRSFKAEWELIMD
jgi:hypothetical protein